MNLDPILVTTRAAEICSRGLWQDKTIQSYIARTLEAMPNKAAIVAYRQDWSEPKRISYRELEALVQQIALSLAAMGVKRQDVVSFQLPNWWEFIALSLACIRIGAVANPLMPIFRERELTQMLEIAESKVLVVPKKFRGFDYQCMARGLKASLPRLERVVVVDGDGDDSFNNLLAQNGAVLEASLPEMEALQPDDVLLVMFTSGTTGEPKGVMHTSNTLIASLHLVSERLGVTAADNVLSASPLGHLTGYAILAMLPLMLGSTAVLQDVWEGHRALEIIAAESVAFTAGATPFLVDLCEAVASGDSRTPAFRLFMCAGAPIPPSLIERALNTMGATVVSAWGMTEVVAGSITEPERATEKSSRSDGTALPNVELMIADEEGLPLPTGETGRLLIKTPSLFGGYLKRPEYNNLSQDGWFDTGDLAYLDEDNYLRINGRSKDIIIRGGENIPVVCVENLLYSHPSVAMVAIVGYPDSRMGERACAFVVPARDATFTFEDMNAYFDECKLTKQYRPERLEIVDALPRTAAGKIQKYRLREEAKKYGDA